MHAFLRPCVGSISCLDIEGRCVLRVLRAVVHGHQKEIALTTQGINNALARQHQATRMNVSVQARELGQAKATSHRAHAALIMLHAVLAATHMTASPEPAHTGRGIAA